MSNSGRRIKLNINGVEFLNEKITIPIVFKNDFYGRPRNVARKIINELIEKNFISPADIVFDLLTRESSLNSILETQLEKIKVKKTIYGENTLK